MCTTLIVRLDAQRHMRSHNPSGMVHCPDPACEVTISDYKLDKLKVRLFQSSSDRMAAHTCHRNTSARSIRT